MTLVDLNQQEWERNVFSDQASRDIPLERNTSPNQGSDDIFVERNATSDQGCSYAPLERSTLIIQVMILSYCSPVVSSL